MNQHIKTWQGAQAATDADILALFEVVKHEGGFTSMALNTDKAILAFARALLAAQPVAQTDKYAGIVKAATNVVGCFNDPHISLAGVARWVNQLSEELGIPLPAGPVADSAATEQAEASEWRNDLREAIDSARAALSASAEKGVSRD